MSLIFHLDISLINSRLVQRQTSGSHLPTVDSRFQTFIACVRSSCGNEQVRQLQHFSLKEGVPINIYLISLRICHCKHLPRTFVYMEAGGTSVGPVHSPVLAIGQLSWCQNSGFPPLCPEFETQCRHVICLWLLNWIGRSCWVCDTYKKKQEVRCHRI